MSTTSLSAPSLTHTQPLVEIARRNRAEEGGWCTPIPVNRNRVVRNVVVLPSSWFLSRFAPEGFVGPPTKPSFSSFEPGSSTRKGRKGFAAAWPVIGPGVVLSVSACVCVCGTRELLLAAESNFGWIRICRVDPGGIWNRGDAFDSFIRDEVNEFNLAMDCLDLEDRSR